MSPYHCLKKPLPSANREGGDFIKSPTNTVGTRLGMYFLHPLVFLDKVKFLTTIKTPNPPTPRVKKSYPSIN